MKNAFDFLPRGFASLTDYISPSAFAVVDWKSALKKSAILTIELIFSKSLSDKKEKLKMHLPEGIRFVENFEGEKPNQEIEWNHLKSYGEKVLELYFKQIKLRKVVLLDLRPDRFLWDEKNTLQWKPNGLWYEFSENFYSGIELLYKGFYQDKQDLLEAGLQQLGLSPPGLEPEAKKELLKLLDNHFGAGKSKPMAFRTKDFMKSFDGLFLHLKAHKITLSEDFLFMGIYLVTLYLHLEKLEIEFDVQKAFQSVYGDN